MTKKTLPFAGFSDGNPFSDNEFIRSAWQRIRPVVGTVALFSVVINVLMLTTSIYLMQVSDRVMVSRSNETLILLTVFAVGALVVLAIFDLLRKWLLARIGVQLETSLGGPLLAASIDRPGVAAAGEVQSLRDLATVRGFVAGPVVPVLFDLPMAPLYVLVVYLIHPHLGLITLLGMVMLGSLAFVNQAVTKKALAAASKHSQVALNRATSQARNADAIRAMGMIGECVRAWGADNVKALETQLSASNQNGIIAAFSKFWRLALQIAILGWGTYLGLVGEVTAGMAIAASIIGARALAPVEGAIESWKTFVGAREAWDRICALLMQSSIAQPRTKLPDAVGEIFCDKLVYMSPTTREPIIKQITFGVLAGSSVALIGPTGAGKSTLAKLIVGALPSSAGVVRLDGSDLRNWDPRQLGRSVGYLPQDVELFPGTIAENIARLRTDVSSEDIVAAAKFANVHDLIVRMKDGYETIIHERGAPLSGGQRQRVALARAFFGMPRLVVLDEPDANLDQDGEEALAKALVRARETGMTVIVSTQRRNILGALDRILLLRDGVIEMYGPRDQVLARMATASQPTAADPPRADKPTTPIVPSGAAPERAAQPLARLHGAK